MADPQSIIALNIGSQRVTMGVMTRSSKGGLVLQKYESSHILADPAADMTRLPQIRIAVNELASKLGVSKQAVNYAISGQSVFTRFVKLPVLEDDDIEQLVTFEAQQNVPFPINEVVWDWQLIKAEAGQQEVVLVAIKSDALDELNDCVADAGLFTKIVDASPMALANAFRYNYGDLEESALLIDIGARTSNLVYMDGDKIFTRTIAIGGSTVTSAIAKEYHVPFVEAESQKCSNGLVALDTRHTSQLDDLTAALGSCIRTALNRMPAEIARTTNFFRSQHEGGAPKRVILAGGGANLNMISDFFQDKLRVPVEYFNPLRRVSVGKEVDVDRVTVEAHLLGEIVGLGLRSIEKSKLNIDLVPDTVQEERADAKRRPKLLIAAGIAVAACAIYAVTGFMHKKKVGDEVAASEKKLADIEQFSNPINRQLQNARKAGSIVNMYGEAVSGRIAWIDILNDFNKHFADHNLWVVQFEPLVDYELKQDGMKTYVDSDFTGVEYNKSMLSKLDGEPEFINGRPNKKYTPPTVNAIRVRGYWRGDTNDDVLSRYNHLIAESDQFTDKIQVKSLGKKKKMKEVDLNDLIIENESAKAEGKVAAPFTFIVLLTNPVPVK